MKRLSMILVSMFILLAYTVSADIIITEVWAPPTGVDKNYEFIELTNDGSSSVTIPCARENDGWSFTHSEPETQYHFLCNHVPSVTLSPDESVVFARNADPLKIRFSLTSNDCQVIDYRDSNTDQSNDEAEVITVYNVPRENQYFTPGSSNVVDSLNYGAIGTNDAARSLHVLDNGDLVSGRPTPCSKSKDSDGDGILDHEDNCPDVANSGQENYDGDEEGDACDSDDDNDGISDTSDKCQFSLSDNQRIASLNPNHYASRDSDINFETKNPKTKEIVDGSYTLSQTKGCGCADILSVKPGDTEGEWKFGCTEGTIKNVIAGQGWAKDLITGGAIAKLSKANPYYKKAKAAAKKAKTVKKAKASKKKKSNKLTGSAVAKVAKKKAAKAKKKIATGVKLVSAKSSKKAVKKTAKKAIKKKVSKKVKRKNGYKVTGAAVKKKVTKKAIKKVAKKTKAKKKVAKKAKRRNGSKVTGASVKKAKVVKKAAKAVKKKVSRKAKNKLTAKTIAKKKSSKKRK